MSEMVDRVARALFEWQAAHGDWNAADDEEIREDCRIAARAAIDAMREPTEAMSRAGFCANRFTNNLRCCDSPRRMARVTLPAEPVWNAMIDEALKD